jgi:hypothetical protein
MAYRPFAGMPLTATMSAKPVATQKLLELRKVAGEVAAALAPYCDASEASLWYWTKFSISIVRIVGGAACPRARRQAARMTLYIARVFFAGFIAFPP